MFQGNEDSATKIAVALIAAGASLIGAIFSLAIAFFTFRNTRRENEKNRVFNEKLDERKKEFEKEADIQRQIFQKDLERIKAGFNDENAEKNARREYEYEARQRLYVDIEPLLFQLAERGEEVMYRIIGMAGGARKGNLGDGGVFSDFTRYYEISNAYKFIAPLAVIKLIQQKLTAVDLSLVPRISKLYRISKFLTWSFTDDHVIGNIEKLQYEPEVKDWKNLRIENQAVYWRQGIPTGRLDTAIESLIDNETNQCISFGDFESQWRNNRSKIHGNFEIIFDLFLDFHPRTRPILWRILLVQAHIYYSLLQDRNQRLNNEEESVEVIPLRSLGRVLKLHYEDDKNEFEWRSTDERDEISIKDVLETPFKTAEVYLKDRLGDLFQDRVVPESTLNIESQLP